MSGASRRTSRPGLRVSARTPRSAPGAAGVELPPHPLIRQYVVQRLVGEEIARHIVRTSRKLSCDVVSGGSRRRRHGPRRADRPHIALAHLQPEPEGWSDLQPLANVRRDQKILSRIRPEFSDQVVVDRSIIVAGNGHDEHKRLLCQRLTRAMQQLHQQAPLRRCGALTERAMVALRRTPLEAVPNEFFLM